MKDAKVSNAAKLRQAAEEKWASSKKRRVPLPESEDEIKRLLHELEVQHIELEIQNEELLQSRSEMEILLRQYRELYDSAPAGYLTVMPDGSILQCNETGAKLLERKRGALIRKRLGVFIAEQSLSDFNALLDSVQVSGGSVSCEIAISTSKNSDTWVLLEATFAPDGRRRHLVMMDITARRAMAAKLETHRKMLEASRNELRKLTQHLQSVREEERTMLARELHDEIGHQLTVIKMSVFFIEKGLDEIADPERREELLREIRSTSTFVSNAIRTTQRIVRGLRPEILDTFGLSAALEFELQQFEKNTHIRCAMTLPEDMPELDNHRSTTLYRIFQEALTNVARHATATSVQVSIDVSEGSYRLVVKDDGAGFKSKDLLKVDSYGVLGMKERLAELAGTLDIRVPETGGTMLTAVFPITGA